METQEPTTPAPAPEATVDNAEKKRKLRETVVRVLRTVYDPEIPVNIYELGLIYSIDVSAEGFVHIKMTLTAPNCPVAETMPMEIEAKVRAIPEVGEMKLELVWEPQWTMAMMSEAARLTLGF